MVGGGWWRWTALTPLPPSAAAAPRRPSARHPSGRRRAAGWRRWRRSAPKEMMRRHQRDDANRLPTLPACHLFGRADGGRAGGGPHRRDDATLYIPPACHLFGCAFICLVTKEGHPRHQRDDATAAHSACCMSSLWLRRWRRGRRVPLARCPTGRPAGAAVRRSLCPVFPLPLVAMTLPLPCVSTASRG